MKLDSTIRSPAALILGTFFAAVTARTIFDDVWNGAPVTIAHVNALAALVAAVASGHFLLPAILHRRPAAAVGLAAIFIAATSYVVISSGSRNAEVASLKAAAIAKTNEERAGLKVKLAEAEADVDQAKADFDAAKADAARECASGKGKRCDGKAATRDAAAKDFERAESHAGMMRGKLAYLGPETRPFEGYHHAAAVFEAAGLGDAGEIEARLELLMPFGLVLISELGTIVYLGMALGRRPADHALQTGKLLAAPTGLELAGSSENNERGDETATNNQADLVAVSDYQAAELHRLIRPNNSLKKRPRDRPKVRYDSPKPGRIFSKADALDDLMQRLAEGEHIPSQAALADAWRRPKQTASTWLKEWRALGIIPAPVRAGRRNETTA